MMNTQMNTQMNDQNKAVGVGRRNRKWRGLVGLNAVLLGTLGVLSFSPWAGAQSSNGAGDRGNRVRGDYSVVGGANIGGVASVIYVVDTANGEMIALDWNDSIKSLEGVGYRDLRRDATSDPDR